MSLKCHQTALDFTSYLIVESRTKIENAYMVKHSHASHSLFSQTEPPSGPPKETFCFFFCSSSFKPDGIHQPQTELIALNHSRSLKVSDRGDVISGVAEVAWESIEIRGLTSLQSRIQSRLISHPFRPISSTTGLIWENTLVQKSSGFPAWCLGRACASVCVCVCVLVKAGQSLASGC